MAQCGCNLITENATVGGRGVDRLPCILAFARDVKMKSIATIIQSVPNLKNNPSASLVGVKKWSLNNRPVLKLAIIVPDAGHE